VLAEDPGLSTRDPVAFVVWEPRKDPAVLLAVVEDPKFFTEAPLETVTSEIRGQSVSGIMILGR
jgi:hypothetical protein